MNPHDLPTLTVGQRIRHHRERQGKTRAVLGGLVGRSEEWVKAVETGRQLPPRLPMLTQLANALRVDVWTLADTHQPATGTQTGPGHHHLPAVREALNRWPLPDRDPQPLAHIEARIATAWRARHAAPDHRTVIGALLPDLIRDTQQATRTYRGQQQRRAQAALANVLGLTQMFLAYQPAADLLWRAVDRAILAAHESGDPVALAGAVWFAGAAHRDTGDWDTSTAVITDTLTHIEPHLADGPDDLLAMWGSLHVEAAHTAAAAGNAGVAWRHMDIAEKASKQLPSGYYHPWTSFSRVIMGAHAVTTEVELRKAGHALRVAGRHDPELIPSRPRRARHLIEIARGHHLRNEVDAVAAMLDQAYTTAPETIRYNGYARSMVLEMLDGPVSVRRQARDLATKVGLIERG